MDKQTSTLPPPETGVTGSPPEPLTREWTEAHRQPTQLQLNFNKKYGVEYFKQQENAVKSILRGLAILNASEELANEVMSVIAGEIPSIQLHIE